MRTNSLATRGSGANNFDFRSSRCHEIEHCRSTFFQCYAHRNSVDLEMKRSKKSAIVSATPSFGKTSRRRATLKKALKSMAATASAASFAPLAVVYFDRKMRCRISPAPRFCFTAACLMKGTELGPLGNAQLKIIEHVFGDITAI